MKKSMILVAVLAVVASMPAHGWAVYLHNETGKAIKVNIGCVGMKASFHIAMAPGQKKKLSTATCKSCNGVNYIPKWVSAYMYDGHWENERTIVEDKNIESCLGDKALEITQSNVSCYTYQDYLQELRKRENCGACVFRFQYDEATGWDFD